MAESPFQALFETPQSVEGGLWRQLWGSVVLVALPLVLYFVYRDLGTYLQLSNLDRMRFHPTPLAWQALFFAQIASKLPIAYRYGLRGVVAGADLGGFVLGLVATAWLGWSLPTGSGAVWLPLLGVGVVWLGFEMVVTAFPPRSAGPVSAGLGRRLYCAFAAGLVPGVPFVFALFLLSASR